MSKVIFGCCDVDNGLLVVESQDEDTQEDQVVVNVFGDGSHAFTALSHGEAEALQISLTRYLGLPSTIVEVHDVE